MDDIDFIFTNEQYAQLQKEYTQTLLPQPSSSISTLTEIIHALQIQDFTLPQQLKNEIIRTLSSSVKILQIIYCSKPCPTPHISNNVHSLIYHLTNLSIELSIPTIKSPCQILSLKANTLILKSIQLISGHFANKNDTIFRFNKSK